MEAGSSVLPVVVVDPAIIDRASPRRVAFFLDCLRALRGRYRDHGSDLVVRHGPPDTVLAELAEAYDADGVHWNRDVSGHARRRDDAVAEALAERDVAARPHDDLLLHEPGSVLTNAGDPYRVFSPFFDKWRDREKDAPLEPPSADALADGQGEPIPSLADLDVAAPTDPPRPDAGMAAARDRLEAFCAGPIFRYETDRDVPAEAGTSRLSPHLRLGTVGIRAVWDATSQALESAPDDAARDSVWAFRRQLAFREFYAHALSDRPQLVSENARAFETPVDWRNDPDEIAAWRAGETGYPIVDAGMRQLRATGWMHNRVRMIVASFLTKDLLVDWRVGYRWFRSQLVDHDPANDAGGWQWAASTGVDAQPYFRVFNPTTQGERYDPDAEYITAHVPELRETAPETVHDWPTLDPAEREAAAPDYPAPIVDHAARREAAIAAFEAAREG